jgi:F-type H+-transporting ATPase subunit epsilon
MATISFDLVTPEQLLFNDEVGMIIVPGKDGDIGVLPGHSKVLSSLRSGRVMVYGEDKNLLKSFFVESGFVEINPKKCIVLAEGVNEMSSLDKSAIEKEVQELEGQDSHESKLNLTIGRSKIEALNSSHYEKIQ